MDKKRISEELKRAMQTVIDWVENQPNDQLNKKFIEGKWPIFHHIYHLLKTTRAVDQGFKMPKLMLKMSFGTNNRTERSYAELVARYQKQIKDLQMKSPKNYTAAPERIFEKKDLLDKFSKAMQGLIINLNKWDEKDLSKYIVPHPAIGKCTLREISYFTIYHTYHHLNILKNMNGGS